MPTADGEYSRSGLLRSSVCSTPGLWQLKSSSTTKRCTLTEIIRLSKIPPEKRVAEITKEEAGDALNAFMDAVGDTLKKDDKLTLIGFGTFSVSKRAARNGRNPQTGKTIKIPAKNVAKFKVGKKLDEAVQ